MKKILLIMGSPRKDGNVSNILSTIKSKLNDEYDVEIINLVDQHINGCLGCSRCQCTREYKCVQNDDMNALLNKMIDSDAIIYGTPLYGHNYSGQMKIFLDRHVPLFKFVEGEDKSVDEMMIISAIKDKPVGLVVSCQGPKENNTELISMMFDKFAESSLSNAFGKYVFPFCNPEASKSYYDEETIDSLLNDLNTCLK